MFQNGRGLGLPFTGVEPGVFPSESREWGSQIPLHSEVLLHAHLPTASDGTQEFVFHREDAEVATLCPVVSSQLRCFTVLRAAAGAGRSWISSWERKKSQTWRNFSAHKAFMSWKMLVGVLFNSGWRDAGNITPVWIRSNLHTCVFWRHLKVFI